MLLRFGLKNYKSYKGFQNFSMISGNTKSYEDRLQKEKDFSVLKFSAIYGANGAGKTNIIDALQHMQLLVLNGVPPFILQIYYKLDKSEKKTPSYFETDLLIEENVYTYGFEYDSVNNKLLSEWLVKINGKKEKDIYTRDMVSGTFYCNEDYNKKSKGKMKIYLEDLKEEKSKLFLTFINSNKKSIVLENKELSDIYDWFDNSLSIAAPNSILTSGEYLFVEEKMNQLAALLKMFGTGIQSIGGIVVDNETAFQSIPSEVIDKVKADIQETKNGKKPKKASVLLRSDKSMWNIVMEHDEMTFKKICFYHDKNKEYPFSISDESSGTKRIIDLAEILLTDEKNKLFVIDELDRKLHPQLTCKFVQTFLEKAKCSNNQLIVTTHESRLLDFNILRRDEIWFSNKEDSGESKIYSLDDFNVRFDKKIDKAYLDGRYGGVPIFDTIFPSIEKCQE